MRSAQSLCPLASLLLSLSPGPAARSQTAALLRLSSKGALRVGADADLVVLDAEYRVRDVMARGSWHMQGDKTERRGTFETA